MIGQRLIETFQIFGNGGREAKQREVAKKHEDLFF
jgi:hypothetical protein